MNRITWMILILYVCTAVFHAWLQLIQGKGMMKALYVLIMDLAFPCFGFFFVWFCDLLAIHRKQDGFTEMVENRYYDEDDLQLLQKPDRKSEIDRVSMQEALQFNSYGYRRNMIMQILMEDDPLQYLDVLQQALNNDDTETSHYASTIIMELQRKMQEDISMAGFALQKDPDNMEKAKACQSVLYKVIASELFDEHNRALMYHQHQEVIQTIMEHDAMDETCYRNDLDVLLRMKNMTEAMRVSGMYREYFPESEDAVAYLLKCLIAARDGTGIQEMMNSLSSMPVTLTQKTLPYVRMFQRSRT